MPSEHGGGYENAQVVGLATILIDGLIRESHELMNVKTNDYPELEMQEIILLGAYKLALFREISNDSKASIKKKVLLELGIMIHTVRKAITERTNAEANSRLTDEPILLTFPSDR